MIKGIGLAVQRPSGGFPLPGFACSETATSERELASGRNRRSASTGTVARSGCVSAIERSCKELLQNGFNPDGASCVPSPGIKREPRRYSVAAAMGSQRGDLTVSSQAIDKFAVAESSGFGIYGRTCSGNATDKASLQRFAQRH